MPYDKRDFAVGKVRRFLEPGPIVLVTSRWRGRTNIMTMGWHMVMEFEPSRLGCFITSANRSFAMIRDSGECVINVPTTDLADAVVGIGNTHGGPKVDKFALFGLTAAPASTVKAPLIAECYANFECKVTDTSLLDRYSMFVLEVTKAHVARAPRYPRTLHYRGDGVFMISGRNIDLSSRFRPENL
ncbi:MAG: flavin reductase family protein [Parvibaculaceae bacterium]